MANGLDRNVRREFFIEVAVGAEIQLSEDKIICLSRTLPLLTTSLSTDLIWSCVSLYMLTII